MENNPKNAQKVNGSASPSLSGRDGEGRERDGEGRPISILMENKKKDAQTANGSASPSLSGRDGEGRARDGEGRDERDGEGRPTYFRHTADLTNYGLLKQFARENRNNMTESENALWSFLRSRFNGFKFRRQYIIGEYIVDFICLDKNLIIEVDGGYHSEPRQQEDDAVRQQWLENQGFKVLRFTNEEILFDTEHSLNIIRQNLDLLPSNR